MRLIFTAAMLCGTVIFASPSNSNPNTDKEKEKSKKDKKGTLSSKNFHSIRKWKMTIEYQNGDIISKTIIVEKSSSVSAMEMAFDEAEKYVKRVKKVKGYQITPIADNNYVLLAGSF